MKKLYIVLLVGLLASCQEKTSAPTLILYNGKIWTAEGLDTFVEAVAISGDTISAIGSSETIKALASDNTRMIDLQGKLVTPGFNDAHIHFLSGSHGLAEVELTETYSRKQVLEYIVDYVKTNPDKKWITGRGWQYTFFKGGLPHKSTLDSIESKRPVFIKAYDGHSAWANSAALTLAGIDKNFKYTGFGEVVRDKNGEPTGALKEDAMDLVSKLAPPRTREDNLNALRIGMKRAASLGITSIQNASGNANEVTLYEELLKNNELTLRVSTALGLDEKTSTEAIDEFIDARTRVEGNPKLRAHAIKFMIDGVIEGHTAFMLEPYVDVVPKELSPLGQVSMPLPTYADLVVRMDSHGFQLYTHAIGDRGVRETLNAYELALKKNGKRDARHRIEHIETINPEDIPRFVALDVMPSMEPIHAEPMTMGVWEKAIGPKRLPNSFAWAAMLKAGAKLVYSSDWPACVSLNPIRGLHVAVNRRTVDGWPENGWVPEQKISIAQALYAYTYMGAYASFEEKIKGKIATGYLADVIVHSQDLFTIPSMDIHKAQVDLTVFDGQVVYERK
jgi:predicted amidohydrolase YtcJ